jgi:RNA polymerase sigma-70 factor (ECF subfamily)
MANVAAGITFDMERLQLCLQHLAERERTVVLMSFFDDSSAEEVARALGISAANVRVIRHRGVEHLRGCVEGKAVHRA